MDKNWIKICGICHFITRGRVIASECSRFRLQIRVIAVVIFRIGVNRHIREEVLDKNLGNDSRFDGSVHLLSAPPYFEILRESTGRHDVAMSHQELSRAYGLENQHSNLKALPRCSHASSLWNCSSEDDVQYYRPVDQFI